VVIRVHCVQLAGAPRAGSGPSNGGPAESLHTKSARLSVAEWLGLGLKG
jgi:hypothetical protein